MSSVHIKTTLPSQWYRDAIFAETVYDRIFALHQEGLSNAAVALRVGCTDRTVWRTLKRGEAPQARQKKSVHLTPHDYNRALQDAWNNGYEAALAEKECEHAPMAAPDEQAVEQVL